MCVTFSHDCTLIFAGTLEGSVWHCKVNEKEIRRLFDTNGNILTAGILSLALSKDSDLLLLGCADGSVRGIDVRSGKERFQLHGHEGPVWSVAFLHNGNMALSGSTDDYTICLWDLKQRKLLHRFKNGERVSCLSVSKDDRFFVTTRFKEVCVFDIKEKKEVRSLTGHQLRVVAAYFDHTGERIISLSGDGTIRVWSAKTGKCLKELGDREILAYSLAVSPDGRRALVGKINEMQLWDISTGCKIRQYGDPEGVVRDLDGGVCVSFSPDGCYAVSGESGSLQLWRMPNLRMK